MKIVRISLPVEVRSPAIEQTVWGVQRVQSLLIAVLGISINTISSKSGIEKRDRVRKRQFREACEGDGSL